jgi:hypothetical protein
VGLGQRDHKKYLGNLEPYSGLTWWTLSREACQYVVEFWQAHPAVAEFFENTHAPEESFIHTILGNSPFKSRMRRTLLYEDWRSPAAHPEMIGEKHLELFASQPEVSLQDLHGPGELLFARKFSDDDFQMVERVAALIEKKETLVQANPH